jgi:hypothetical protein
LSSTKANVSIPMLRFSAIRFRESAFGIQWISGYRKYSSRPSASSFCHA